MSVYENGSRSLLDPQQKMLEWSPWHDEKSKKEDEWSNRVSVRTVIRVGAMACPLVDTKSKRTTETEAGNRRGPNVADTCAGHSVPV